MVQMNMLKRTMNSLEVSGMDNTLWHFGDSFGCWGNPEQTDKEAKKGFSEYIAEHYKMNFKHFAKQGSSNDEITKNIISQLSSFKKGDILLINWSFLSRYSYVDMFNKVKNTNDIICLLNDNTEPSDLDLNKFEFQSKEYFDFIFYEKSKFMLEECLVMWEMYINPILLHIQNTLKCTIINSFIDNVYYANHTTNGFPSKYYSKWLGSEDRSDIATSLFPLLDSSLQEIIWGEENNKYLAFLHEEGFYKDGEDVHYKFGTQKKLAEEWILRINQQFFKKII